MPFDQRPLLSQIILQLFEIYHPANRSITEKDENITPCSYQNSAISYTLSMMKRTYLCCKNISTAHVFFNSAANF